MHEISHILHDLKLPEQVESDVLSVYRLIAEAKQTPEGISVSVAPRRVSESSPFYSVNGVFNAILVHGNMVGDVFFAGQGAGMDATGSAVSSDVLEALAYANRNEIRSEKKC